MARLPTTSAGCRSIEMYRISIPDSAAASRHSAWVKTDRGSLTTSWVTPSAWSRTQPASSSRMSSVIAAWARSRAEGRLSNSWMPARSTSALWNFTLHWFSKKPLGFDSLAPRYGPGTSSPRWCSVPDIVLVPLRPVPVIRTRIFIGSRCRARATLAPRTRRAATTRRAAWAAALPCGRRRARLRADLAGRVLAQPRRNVALTSAIASEYTA